MKKTIKQKNVTWLGILIESLYTALPILSIVNFLAILTVLYANVHPYLQEYAPWLRFWAFLIILGILTTVSIVLVYKFVVPSLWAFRSKQMFEHESEITNKLNELNRKLEEVDKKISNTSKEQWRCFTECLRKQKKR